MKKTFLYMEIDTDIGHHHRMQPYQYYLDQMGVGGMKTKLVVMTWEKATSMYGETCLPPQNPQRLVAVVSF